MVKQLIGTLIYFNAGLFEQKHQILPKQEVKRMKPAIKFSFQV